MADKTALITGAARRIGAAIARHLHANAFSVVIHYNRSAAQADALADELNRTRAGSARTLQADLMAASSCDLVVEEALTLTGRLDALVNNASVFYPSPLPDIAEPAWNEVIGANLKAPLFLARSAAPRLEQTGGSIVNISDIHGSRPLPGHTIYSVSKSGLDMLTRSLARELAPKVRVNAVSPGAILWPAGMDDETRDSIMSAIPLQRLGDPADIARAVHFLIAEAGYITGQVLTVDGGRSLSD